MHLCNLIEWQSSLPRWCVAVKAKADSCGEQKRKGFQAREKCVSCPIYEGKAYDESPPWGAAAGVESKSGIQAYHTPHETSDS